MKFNKSQLGIGIIIGILISSIFWSVPQMKDTHVDEMRSDFIELKNSIQEELRPHQQYRCCLENPCSYCIEKTPGHGEGAICDCLSDIINGVHPCGECIGEILEGHGNKYLAGYFAKAIAEKVGKEHEPTLKKIIEQKYGIPVEKQA